MLSLLAQTTYDYSYNTLTTEEKSGLAGFALFSGFFLVIWLVVAIVAIVAMWKVFEKAGEAGWKSIIPFYNSYILAEISGKPGVWGLALPAASVIAWIPVIGWLAVVGAYVLYIIIALELAKKFGKDTTFAVLWLIIFSLVGLLILGFGDAKYQGAKAATAKPAAKA